MKLQWTYAEMKALTDEQLVAAYDELSSAYVGLDFIRAELATRAAEHQTERIADMTATIKWLTVANVGVAAVAALAAFVSLFT